MSEPPDLTIGTTIAHFEVEAELGRGGMGVVYLARDVNLSRAVALKLLPHDRMGDSERRARFLREARSAASVNHPNVATIYEAGEAGETIYIAMDTGGIYHTRTRRSRGRSKVSQVSPLRTPVAESRSPYFINENSP